MTVLPGSIVKWATSDLLRMYRRNNYFRNLEPDHKYFYNAISKIKSSYIWPKQPLFEWSRRAEYPFIIQNVENIEFARVLDAGSGVTFFPYYLLSHYGFDVECLDKDPSYSSLMQKVLDALNSKLSIPFHVGDITTHLPIPANTYDVVYCISVIEHLPPEKRVYAVIELWRLIKPGGHLLLTLDVSLTNQNEDGIPLSQVELFVNEIGNLQDFPSISLFPLPHDLLTPQKPSYGLAPVRLGKKVIRTGIESALLRLKKVSLPGFPSMCCLMIKFQKTANHVPR